MTNVNSSPSRLDHTVGCANTYSNALSIRYEALVHLDANLHVRFCAFTFATNFIHKPPGPYFLAMKMPLGTHTFSDGKLSAFYCLLIPLAHPTLGANVMVGF